MLLGCIFERTSIQRKHSCKALTSIKDVKSRKKSQAITNHDEAHTSLGTVHQDLSSATEDVLPIWIQSTLIHVRYFGVWRVKAQVYLRTFIGPHHTGEVGWIAVKPGAIINLCLLCKLYEHT